MAETPKAPEAPQAGHGMWEAYKAEVAARPDEKAVKREAQGVYKAIDERLARMAEQGVGHDALVQQKEFYKLDFTKVDFEKLCNIMGIPETMPLGKGFREAVRRFQKEKLHYKKPDGIIGPQTLVDIDTYTGVPRFVRNIARGATLGMNVVVTEKALAQNNDRPKKWDIKDPYAETEPKPREKVTYVTTIQVAAGTPVYLAGAKAVVKKSDGKASDRVEPSGELSRDTSGLYEGKLGIVGVQEIKGKEYLRVMPVDYIPSGTTMIREEYIGAIRLLDPVDAKVKIVGSNGAIRIEPQA